MLELKQKEYMKIVTDVPVKDLPIFFQRCQEIGLTGEGVYYFLTSLDFHGQISLNRSTTETENVNTRRLSDEEIKELMFNDIKRDQDNTTSAFR